MHVVAKIEVFQVVDGFCCAGRSAVIMYRCFDDFLMISLNSPQGRDLSEFCCVAEPRAWRDRGWWNSDDRSGRLRSQAPIGSGLAVVSVWL